MTERCFQLSHKDQLLHCVAYIPEGEVRAVLQIVHGMVEYVERYRDFAAFLCERGIAVVGHDHPGHGQTAKTEADLGYIDKKEGSELLVECAAAVTERISADFPGVPRFILGHSMGSFVLRRYLTRHSDKVNGAIVMGTAEQPLPVLIAGKGLASFIGALLGKRHRSKLLTDISFAGYNSRFDKAEGIHAWISRDREIVKKYDADPYCTYTFTASAFYVLYDTIYALAKKRGFENVRKDIPVLVTAGESDPVGAYGKGPTACADTFKALGLSDVTLTLYKDMRHEVLNEIGREEVYKDILNWLEDRMI